MRWLPVGVVLLLGCPRPPTPPPPPPPPSVPAGCLVDLSGRYAHAEDGAWTYQARDDGGALDLDAFHALAVDAGFRPRLFGRDGGFHLARRDGGLDDGGLEDGGLGGEPPAPAPPRPVASVRLVRGPGGFTGEAVTTVDLPGGRTCEAHFAAEVLACPDGGLVLAVEPSTALGDSCQAPAHPAQERVRHELRRR